MAKENEMMNVNDRNNEKVDKLSGSDWSSEEFDKRVEEQYQMIKKGAIQVIEDGELRRKIEKSLSSGKPLVIKLGLDPSAPDLHLGHSVVLRKIRQMQDMGHHAVIIIGDFTGRIGDPTGRSKKRNALSEEEVILNAKTYATQVFHVLDEEKTTIRFNSEWLKELNFEQVLQLAMTTTIARLLERDDFNNRYRAGVPIGLHEFFYPLMQAYDSVEIKADIELGGTDQTFNILMGRNLMKSLQMEEQVAIFMPILPGLDGKEKMSKSLGNYIGLYEKAEVMFKKVMEIPDDLIITYYDLVTDIAPATIKEVANRLSMGANPRDEKLILAEIITGYYHSKEKVSEAKKFYEEAFSKKGSPSDVPELVIGLEEDLLIQIIPLLVQYHYVESGSAFRRLVSQGGVRINDEVITDLQTVLFHGDVIRIGKKVFVKVVK